MTITAKYKGSLGNKIKIVSIENPAGGFDVSVILDGSEVELFEGVKTVEDLKDCSEYVTFTGAGTLKAFASVSLTGATDDASGNAGISDFLDKSESYV